MGGCIPIDHKREKSFKIFCDKRGLETSSNVAVLVLTSDWDMPGTHRLTWPWDTLFYGRLQLPLDTLVGALDKQNIS